MQIPGKAGNTAESVIKACLKNINCLIVPQKRATPH